MRVQVHAADSGGCGFYRLLAPVAALQGQGFDVFLGDTLQGRFQHGRAELAGIVAPDADVVVFQRPLRKIVAEMIPALQRHGVAVVVEVDDDFHKIPRANPCRAEWTPERSPHWLRMACDRADLVTVSTPALAARYGAHGRVRVLENCVPASYLDTPTPPRGERPVVGWTGSTITHPGDLESTGGGVARAVAETGCRFGVVGTGQGVAERIGIDDVEACGWVDIADYPAAYAAFDVAIVPLVLSDFNEAKSWLKGLEASSVGVPWVASPTGEYARLQHLSGGGIVAVTPASWELAVSWFVESAEMRAEFAGRGKAFAATFTYEARCHLWAEAWADAVVERRRHKAA